MKNNIASSILLGLSVCVVVACAPTPPAAPAAEAAPVPVVAPAPVLEKPSFSVSETVKVSAIVEAIDHDSREVTLRTADDELISFVASDEVRNLKQVSAGDSLLIDYTESLSIDVIANNGVEAAVEEASAMVRAEEGEMPGVAAMDATIVTATVEEIDLESNTFKLKTADGAVNEYVAQNPENLKRASVGDLVVATATSSVSIVVEDSDAQ